MTFPFPTIPPVGSPATVSWTAISHDGSNQGTFTFSGLAIGAAATDRKVVVCVYARQGAVTAVSSMTVGGISATLVLAANNGSAVYVNEMWQADVPTGTTADVVVVFNGNANDAAVSVFRITGAASAAYNTASDILAADPSTTLNVSANGVAIATNIASDAGSAPTQAWTGMTGADTTNLTSWGAPLYSLSSAALAVTATEAGRTISVDETPNGAGSGLLCASWAAA